MKWRTREDSNLWPLPSEAQNTFVRSMQHSEADWSLLKENRCLLTRMFGEPKLKLGVLCLNWVEYGVGDKVVTGWL